MMILTDKMLVQIYEGFGITYNGFFLFVSFITVFLFIAWLIERQRVGFDLDYILDVCFYASIGGLIGARLGYGFFYDPTLFVQFKSEFPFWAILDLFDGGLSAYGAILGSFVSLFFLAYIRNFNTFYFFDLISLSAPIVFFWTRVGQFFSGEILGATARSDFMFAIKNPQEIYSWMFSSKEKLNHLNEIGLDLKFEESQLSHWISYAQENDIIKSHLNLEMISLRNFLSEVISKFHEGFGSVENKLGPYLNYRHPVQIYSLLVEGVILFSLLIFVSKRPQQPGVVTSLFLTFYSISRFSLEYFRMDIEMSNLDFGVLTRGQTLSVVSLLIGIVIFFFSKQTSNIPTQGWGRGQNVRYHRR